jgi:hypothetical protein
MLVTASPSSAVLLLGPGLPLAGATAIRDKGGIALLTGGVPVGAPRFRYRDTAPSLPALLRRRTNSRAVTIDGAGKIYSATVRPPQAEDHRHYCGHEPDNSDDNQDIGHDTSFARYLAVTWKHTAARR